MTTRLFPAPLEMRERHCHNCGVLVARVWTDNSGMPVVEKLPGYAPHPFRYCCVACFDVSEHGGGQ